MRVSCSLRHNLFGNYASVSYFAHQFQFGMSQKSPQASSKTFVAHLHRVLGEILVFPTLFSNEIPKNVHKRVMETQQVRRLVEVAVR